MDHIICQSSSNFPKLFKQQLEERNTRPKQSHRNKSSIKKRKSSSTSYKELYNEESLRNKNLMALNLANKKAKSEDLMTQITYQFKKLEFKDTRKRLERSLKNRKRLQIIEYKKNSSTKLNDLKQKKLKKEQKCEIFQEEQNQEVIQSQLMFDCLNLHSRTQGLSGDIIFIVMTYYSYEKQLYLQSINKHWFKIAKYSLRFAKIVSFTIPSVTKKRYCSLVERINNLTLDDRSLHYNQIQTLNTDNKNQNICSNSTTQSKSDQPSNKHNKTKRKNKRSTANHQSLETRAQQDQYNYMRPPSPKRKRIKVR